MGLFKYIVFIMVFGNFLVLEVEIKSVVLVI